MTWLAFASATWRVDQTSITAAGAIDTFLVLPIGIGLKLALVPFVEITASHCLSDRPQDAAGPD
jgi:hypothetical protein